ncbi:uncharacterized protein LOC135211926 isoform X2 [Macrobrachium nipponense]|uniref:uncharacterized protein LOC135211926 isoform X2 n=1 Tax=Macrobrachium nipponense TaxID=159736 RepID=UPI0030C8A308
MTMEASCWNLGKKMTSSPDYSSKYKTLRCGRICRAGRERGLGGHTTTWRKLEPPYEESMEGILNTGISLPSAPKDSLKKS